MIAVAADTVFRIIKRLPRRYHTKTHEDERTAAD